MYCITVTSSEWAGKLVQAETALHANHVRGHDHWCAFRATKVLATTPHRSLITDLLKNSERSHKSQCLDTNYLEICHGACGKAYCTDTSVRVIYFTFVVSKPNVSLEARRWCQTFARTASRLMFLHWDTVLGDLFRLRTHVGRVFMKRLGNRLNAQRDLRFM